MANDASERARGVANRGVERNVRRGEVHPIVPGKTYNVVGFDIGKSDLKKPGFDRELRPVVRQLERERKDYEEGKRTTHPIITVTGHASESVKAGKGPEFYASERADAVKRYLIEHDVPPDWVQTATSRETSQNRRTSVSGTPEQKASARSATIDIGKSEDVARATHHRSLDNRFADYPEIGPAALPEFSKLNPERLRNQLARREFAEGYLRYPSAELSGPDPHTDDRRNAVWFWLADHARTIKRVAVKRNVDARAIAGAIAWEALENPVPFENSWLWWTTRILGKIHIPKDDNDVRPYWAVATEARGYMARRHADERKRLLESDEEVAIEYIGAIMALIADEAHEYGIEVRTTPGALAWAYHSKDPQKWRAWLWDKRRDSLRGVKMRLPTDAMGWWVNQNLPYLESALK